MSTRNEGPADDEKRGAAVDSISFSFLADHPSIDGWKRKLYWLLAGESDETLFRLGSIEQYVWVLLAESEEPDAEYYFRAALSDVIQSWNPTILESADRLNGILSLIASFTPAVGFGKVLAYLELTENVKRSAEQVSGERQPVDLYKKGLVALGQYYLAPPFHSHEDYGFRAYRMLLERNLKDEMYSGYAAVKLLQLKVLNIRTRRFASLLLSSASAGAEVFKTLLSSAQIPSEAETASRKLGDILVICAKANRIEKFEELAKSNEASFDPEGDYDVFFPTLTLPNGYVLNIFLNMADIEDTALRHYIRYSRDKVRELFKEPALNKQKIGRYISGYISQVISDTNSLDELSAELAIQKAQINVSQNRFVITAIRDNVPDEIALQLENKTENELVKWWVSKSPAHITDTQGKWFVQGSDA